MALILPDTYPGRADPPSVDYPFGSFKNRSAPNVLDGSFLDKDWTNDQLGFFQSLLSAAGISANGQVDKVGSSQYFDALNALFLALSGNQTIGGVKTFLQSPVVPTPANADESANKGYVDGLTQLATSAEYRAGTDAETLLTPAVARAQNIVQGSAVASTSGSAFDFTSIPSWVKRITILFDRVSTSGSSPILIQLGDSGGIETIGYAGSGTTMTASTAGSLVYTAGFGIGHANGASDVMSGSITLTALGGNTWCASGIAALDNAAASKTTAGSKTLSAQLDRVRITTVSGTDLFDAGSINILYE